MASISDRAFCIVGITPEGETVLASVWRPEDKVLRCLALWQKPRPDNRQIRTLLREAMTKFARLEGCDHLVTTGRRGWQREFPDAKLLSVTLSLKV